MAICRHACGYMFTVVNNKSKKNRPEVSVLVNGQRCKVLVDTGSTVHVMNSNTARLVKANLKPCSKQLFAFNASKPLPVIGKFDVNLKYKDKLIKSEFIVVEGTAGQILSHETSCDLGILHIVYEMTADDVYQKYPNLFVGLGKMKNTSVKLHIDENVLPVRQTTHRRIPFHQRKNLSECLDYLLDQDIIEPVTGPTPWINPIVLVSKPKQPGGMRLCVDMRAANKAISRERHLMPTIDEVITRFKWCDCLQ
ncbi:uncharacterized protein LOC117104530 [Anneissia japonica]|uniref:uncharacterized protein LOC117104530 n=1 Tax=Anneissia japonica TaxID=1529436 RepID=UPI0014257E05|nr:uncharacterized protein LOC117104530 [Anneissia japonica]